jgi:large subunit ribosomal protein L24
MKLKKGDSIRVTSGRDKGREGKVDRVYAKQDKVLVKNINMYKKHVKKNEQMPQGGVVEISRPLSTAKVALVCPKCKKITRVGFRIDGSKKFRICRKCEAQI